MVKVKTKAVKAPRALPGVKPRVAADPTAALANHWSKHPALKTLTDLPRLVAEYDGARAAAKEAEGKKETARGSLLTTLQLARIDPASPVSCMGFEVSYTEGAGRVSLEKFEQELIQRGCPSDIMEQAREAAKGKGSITVNVRPVKGLDLEGSKA